MDELKALSDAASPGRLSVAKTNEQMPEQELDDDGCYTPPLHTMTGPEGEGRATVTTDPAYGGWNTDGGCGGYGLSRENAAFIAALWNAYRDGRLVERET